MMYIHTNGCMISHSLKQTLCAVAGFATAKGYLDSLIPKIEDVEKEQRFEHGICVEAPNK